MNLSFVSLIEALPGVATSVYALLAYLVLIFVWGFVFVRAEATRQALAKIQVLPEKDRLTALGQILDSPAVPKGMSAEQWLRSKIHRYYFFAFLALLAAFSTVAILALLPSFNKESGKSAALSAIRIGLSKGRVQHILGPANYVDSQHPNRQLYWDDEFWLVVFYLENRIEAYSFTARAPSFTPMIPLTDVCLQCVPFNKVGSVPHSFNSGQARAEYVELIDGQVSSMGNKTVYVFSTRFGYDGESCFLGFQQSLELDQLTPAQQREVDKNRQNCRPNGYGVASGNAIGSEDFDQDVLYPVDSSEVGS